MGDLEKLIDDQVAKIIIAGRGKKMVSANGSWWKITIYFIGTSEWVEEMFRDFVSGLEEIEDIEVFSAFRKNGLGLVVVKADEQVLCRLKEQQDQKQSFDAVGFDFYGIARIHEETMRALKEVGCLRYLD